ncbi:NB-ARC domain-containing protein [Actinomadura sp. NPDC023710]|uniref:NB-ARC domain-containing protein n=1 Tax=Actinomadura sp. NPDC023710 TaxID=3158219 RepID=UPI003411593A
MTGRVLTWAGGLIAAVSVIGLIVYFAVKGFHWGDTVGVIGAGVGIAGLVMAVYGMIVARRTPDTGQQPDQVPGERSVNLRGDAPNSGIVATGDDAANTQITGNVSGHGRLNQAGRDLSINESTVLPPEAVRPVSEVAAPGLVNVPGHQHVFVGRGDELDELDAALRAPGGVVVAAVHGLGGVGKSTLAARYAAAHAAGAAHAAAEARAGLGEAVFDPVWWITADTAAAVQAGLAGLAAALQPELRTALELEALAERGLAWLGCHSGWLVVLDNVTDPGHIAPLLDRTMRGRVLVTSRLGQGWHRYRAQVLRLDVLTEEQAVDLLTQIAAPAGPGAGSGSTGLDGAAELVAELGCLPLAVEQAAAYLLQNQLSHAITWTCSPLRRR